jgi:glutamyl-Q tRNA(Asp) synthetase
MPHIKPESYRGRFAPSPTGAVHYGTLVAAVGSYLQAKKNSGKWFLRIDDIDLTRKIEGADTAIIETLEAFGFEWHGEIIYQSSQTKYYQQALEQLMSQSLVFPCLCSRKQLAASNSEVYPGTCRHRQLPENKQHALRIRAKNIDISFNDAVMGAQRQNIEKQCGDFIIKRRDGLFAYQLAIVVDDAMQNISEIVRGGDLLDSTPRQIYLQQLLHYPTPAYCHLPLAIDAAGNKISKSTGATRINIENKEKLLLSVLDFLGQQPPDELAKCALNDIWAWAIKHWQISLVPAVTCIQPDLHDVLKTR